jgi:hypothetical protein
MMEKWCIFANSLLLIRSAVKDWSEQLVCVGERMCIIFIFIYCFQFFMLLYQEELVEGGKMGVGESPLVGSIFDDILRQYKSIQKQFIDALITNISSAFKRSTTVYLKKMYG